MKFQKSWLSNNQSARWPNRLGRIGCVSCRKAERIAYQQDKALLIDPLAQLRRNGYREKGAISPALWLVMDGIKHGSSR